MVMHAFTSRLFRVAFLLVLGSWADEVWSAPIPPPDPSRFRLLGTVKPLSTFYQGLPWVTQVSITTPVLLPQQPEEDTLPPDAREALFLARWIDGSLPIFDVVAPSPFRFRVKGLRDNERIQDSRIPGWSSFYHRSPAEFERPVARREMRMSETSHADFLLDLRPHYQSLAPGDYTLSTQLYVDIKSENSRWSAKPVTFQLRALPEKATAILQKAMPSFGRERLSFEFSEWVTEEVDIVLLEAKLPRELFSLVALHCFLNSTRKAGSADKAPLGLLDKVPAELKPVADCLRYEVLLSRKEARAAKYLKEQILRQHPGLKWRVDAADQGWGTLARILRDPPW